MDDPKKDFRDFLYRPEGDSNSGEDSNTNKENSEHAEKPQDRPAANSGDSYYYSYGPYRPASDDSRGNDEPAGPTRPEPAEVIERRPSRVFSYNEKDFSRHATGNWQYNKRKKGAGWKAMFSAFLAGALVVTSLMFVADRYNLFTDGAAAAANAPVSAAVSGDNVAAASSSGDDGNFSAQNAALNSVVRPNDISAIAKQASPAVVMVANYVSAASQQQQMNPFADDPFFQQFFGQQPQTQQPQSRQNKNNSQYVEEGFGSGFIFDKSGYVLTNEHVIDGADQVKVTVEGYSEPFVAKVVGKSFNMDLAVLKIDGDKDFPTLPIDTDVENNLNVGDWVIAIGNPYGFDHTVTVGVLSATGRPIDIPDGNQTRQYTNLLQTDAAINPGNSGGPLLNLEGQVVGINTAINAQAQGIGFAIPASTITSVLQQLKTGEEIPQPFIGVSVSDIPQQWVSQLGLKNTDGAIISLVPYGTPGYKAGLRQYDVITAVDGKTVKDNQALVDVIQSKKVGDTVALTVIRGGKQIEVNVTIGDKNKYQQLTTQ